MSIQTVIKDVFLVLVKNLVGKYSKSALERLETAGLANPVSRKIILDTFNDMYRELEQKIDSAM